MINRKRKIIVLCILTGLLLVLVCSLGNTLFADNPLQASISSQDIYFSQNSVSTYALDEVLIKGASDGDLDIVKQLIEEDGLSPNARASNGMSPLIAASSNGRLAVAQYLVARGALINGTDHHGNTPLMFAAFNNHLSMTLYLFNHNALVNIQNEYGETALIFAAYNGNRQIVQFLVEHGANVNLRDNDGKTACDHAEAQARVYVAEYLYIYTDH